MTVLSKFHELTQCPSLSQQGMDKDLRKISEKRNNMIPARLELATFRVLGGRDNHYTTESHGETISFLRSIENSDDITKESVGDDRPGPLRDKGEQHNVANELRAFSTPLVIGDHSRRKNRDLLAEKLRLLLLLNINDYWCHGSLCYGQVLRCWTRSEESDDKGVVGEEEFDLLLFKQPNITLRDQFALAHMIR
ncbi:hypothetical protein P5673_002328 [Acropora cervicornis]|uniref:Uncharacterized protein n=1 Tax=Acropora cervicornis TaxID=6130 RepID=A0AAD9R3F1_ACRCE|nr:hypothetical protein P5673_002328 [Acropora cervicornis]